MNVKRTTEDTVVPQVKEVRGLTRGLMLLTALNQLPGGLGSTSELARACGIHRVTARRLLETLRAQGVVESTERDGQYKVSRAARRLSDGFAEADWVSRVGGPAMEDVAAKLVWPVNLAAAEGGFMVILQSTRRRSPLSHYHAVLGEKLPMLPTALGRAYLAACNDELLDAILSDLARRATSLRISDEDLSGVHEAIAQTRARGYAVTGDVAASRFDAIAVPLFAGTTLLGAMNMVFTKDSQSQALIEQKHLLRLDELAKRIGSACRSWIE